MKKTFSFVFTFLIGFVSFAQYPFPKKELADLVLDRTLVVQLLSEETALEELMNQGLKEAFEDYPNVVFASLKELNGLKRKNLENYAYLTQPERLTETIRLNVKYVDGSLEYLVGGTLSNPTPVMSDAIKMHTVDKINLDYMGFVLSVFTGKKEEVVTMITFVNSELAKHDYIFLRQQMELLLKSSSAGTMRANYVDEQANIVQLTSRFSYYLKDYFTDVELDQIAENHDQGYKVVNYKDYLEPILNKTEFVAYIKLIYSFMHNKYMWVMVEATSGKILAVNEIGDYKFAGEFEASELIKARHLKYSFHEPTQLLNNYYNK